MRDSKKLHLSRLSYENLASIYVKRLRLGRELLAEEPMKFILRVFVDDEGEKTVGSDNLTYLPYGLEGDIYRSPLPLSPLFDPNEALLDDFVEVGVDVVVMLTPEEEVWEVTGRDLLMRYEALGLDVIYVPVEDFSVPKPGAFQEPIRRALRAAKSGKTLVIHCQAGLGRTGMFAACLAKVVLEMSGEDAVNWVREYVPEAVQTAQQFRFVENFVYDIDGS